MVTAEIHGGISPATSAYFLRVLDEAKSRHAELVVLSLDTPGGLDTAMREMIQGMLASPVPVAIFVAPSGARAASAGTYMLYASHVAAMAPGTNLGAATPVAIGLGGGERGKLEPADKSDKPGKADDVDRADKADGKSKKSGKSLADQSTAGKFEKSGKADQSVADKNTPPPTDTMAAKATHDAAAYIRSLAQLRGRNPEWAERAVRRAESLSAEEALKLNVIDVIATDVADLLKKIDGREVKVNDAPRKLALAGASLEALAPNWKERLLVTIADPNVALLLMMGGVYGLLFEFYAPGTALPGVTGGIALLLGLYGLAMLPVNFVGVALVLLGLALMVAEAFLATFGVIGIGGIVAFVAGAIFLVDAEIPGFTISGDHRPDGPPQCRPAARHRRLRAAGAAQALGRRRRGNGRRRCRGTRGFRGRWFRAGVRRALARALGDAARPRAACANLVGGRSHARRRAGRTGRLTMIWGIGWGGVIIVLVLLVFSSIRIFREYERGVVFLLGRFWQVKGPGLVIIVPVVQQMVRVDLRTVVMDVPSQDVISRDNVSVKVNAVLYFRVIDPQKAIIQVANFLEATSQLAQTTLRSVLGKHELDDMLAERERLNADIQQILDAQTDAWGIKVATVEIKQVDINETMVRAIARQAEAERERRAKVVHAEGEMQAAEKLLQAARVLAEMPQAMQLRYLQTLTAVAGDKSSTIVFPVPTDLLLTFAQGITGRPREGSG